MSAFKIGLCVADTAEYEPIAKMLEAKGATKRNYYKRQGHLYDFDVDGKKYELYAVCCGIGMVNAAVASTILADLGCKIILNTGYSGGISGVYKGQVVVGTRFIEHDFDLTGIGYDEFEKPQQDYIYFSNPEFYNEIKKDIQSVAECVMLSGDRFIASSEDRRHFTELFSQDNICCDMETAAIAYTCSLANIEFMSVRIVSDAADDGSQEEYKNSVQSDITNNFADITLKMIDVILKVGVHNE